MKTIQTRNLTAGFMYKKNEWNTNMIYSNKRQPLSYRFLTWDMHSIFSWPSFLSSIFFFYFILLPNILWGRDQYTVIQTFNSNRTGYRNFRYTKTRYFISETQAQYALNLRIHSYFLGLIRIVSQYVFYKDHQSVTFYLKPE